MVTEAKINEIFSSVQGEGPVVGYKQLFIRFCGCNLNCQYCDTEFLKGTVYTPKSLYKYIINKYDLTTFHSISLTGGEPLLHVDFLKEFLPMLKGKINIYLETNATLYENFVQIKDFIDIVSADIKLSSSSGFQNFELCDKFFSECDKAYCFAKIVFDKNITENEIMQCIYLGEKYNIELVLQPMMFGNNMSVNSKFCFDLLEKFLQKYSNVRLIPQVHKFLDVR